MTQPGESDRNRRTLDRMERLGHDQEQLIGFVLLGAERTDEFPKELRAQVEQLVQDAIELGVDLGDEVVIHP